MKKLKNRFILFSGGQLMNNKIWQKVFEILKDLQITMLGFFIFIATLAGTNILTDNLGRKGISVTGSACEVVKSDSASWRIELTTRSKSNRTAYNIIKNQIPIVEDFLTKNEIEKENIEISPTSSYPVYKTDSETGYTTNEIGYYNYTQSIKVTSDNVELIKKLSTNIQELINQGIELNSFPPEYQYSKMAELKIKLLEEATQDSRKRAQAMLKSSHNRLGKISSIRMGVFQITPTDSNSVTDMGINDLTTIDKKVTAVANVFYQIK